jgi:hypothetical protein
LDKDNNRIENVIKELKGRGNNYFKHCNKEKIETICRWCNKCLHNSSKMVKKNEDYEDVKEKLRPVKLHMRKLADFSQLVHVKRKLLQEVQVGKGVMTALETIILPYIKLITKTLGRKGRTLN